MSTDSVYVVFESSDTKHFLKRFIHPHINHCYLIVVDGDKTIVLNKSIGSVDIYTIDELDDILQTKIIIKVKPRKANRNILMINSCVGQVKQYLGISNPFILTPYQLMRTLKW